MCEHLVYFLVKSFTFLVNWVDIFKFLSFLFFLFAFYLFFCYTASIKQNPVCVYARLQMLLIVVFHSFNSSRIVPTTTFSFFFLCLISVLLFAFPETFVVSNNDCKR